jgi:hypothetical protein
MPLAFSFAVGLVASIAPVTHGGCLVQMYCLASVFFLVGLYTLACRPFRWGYDNLTYGALCLLSGFFAVFLESDGSVLIYMVSVYLSVISMVIGLIVSVVETLRWSKRAVAFHAPLVRAILTDCEMSATTATHRPRRGDNSACSDAATGVAAPDTFTFGVDARDADPLEDSLGGVADPVSCAILGPTPFNATFGHTFAVGDVKDPHGHCRNTVGHVLPQGSRVPQSSPSGRLERVDFDDALAAASPEVDVDAVAIRAERDISCHSAPAAPRSSRHGSAALLSAEAPGFVSSRSPRDGPLSLLDAHSQGHQAVYDFSLANTPATASLGRSDGSAASQQHARRDAERPDQRHSSRR